MINWQPLESNPGTQACAASALTMWTHQEEFKNEKRCEGWWSSGCHSSVAEQWVHKADVLGSIPGDCQLFHLHVHVLHNITTIAKQNHPMPFLLSQLVLPVWSVSVASTLQVETTLTYVTAYMLVCDIWIFPVSWAPCDQFGLGRWRIGQLGKNQPGQGPTVNSNWNGLLDWPFLH